MFYNSTPASVTAANDTNGGASLRNVGLLFSPSRPSSSRSGRGNHASGSQFRCKVVLLPTETADSVPRGVFWDQLDEQNLEIEVHFRTGMTAEAVRRQILTQFQGFGHLDKCEASRDRFSNGIYTSSTRECFVAISILFSLQLFFDYHKLQKLGSVVGNLKCIDKLTCVIKM